MVGSLYDLSHLWVQNLWVQIVASSNSIQAVLYHNGMQRLKWCKAMTKLIMSLFFYSLKKLWELHLFIYACNLIYDYRIQLVYHYEASYIWNTIISIIIKIKIKNWPTLSMTI